MLATTTVLSRGTPSREPQEGVMEPPRSSERFKLLEQLGSGGSGTVWRAWDDCLQCEVALKVFLPEFTNRNWAKVVREVRLGRSLSHPHIVRVYELHPETPAVSMELVLGPTLRDLITSDEPLEGSLVSELLRQICEALAYAHESVCLIHRDIKPSNVLVGHDGRAKVSDFGLSSVEGKSTETMMDGSGTPAFMSPQQAQGDPPSFLDDIYSMGATAFHLITRELPPRVRLFADEESAQPSCLDVLRAALHDLGLPERWAEVVESCLSRDPRSRPRTVRELESQLFPEGQVEPQRPETAELEAKPALVQVPPSAPPPEHHRCRPPTVWAAGFIGFAALLVAGDVAPTEPGPPPQVEYTEYLVLPVQVYPDPNVPVPSPVPAPRERRVAPEPMRFEIEIASFTGLREATMVLERLVALGLTVRRVDEVDRGRYSLRMGRCLSRSEAAEMAARLLEPRGISYRVVAIHCDR